MRFTFFIYLILISYLATSQTSFSQTAFEGDWANISLGVIELDNKYILGGECALSDTSFRSIFFSQYDLNGNFIERAVHTDTNFIISFFHNNHIQLNNDSSIIWNGKGSGRLHLIHYDFYQNELTHLDTIERTEVGDFFSRGFLKDEESYIFSGKVFNTEKNISQSAILKNTDGNSEFYINEGDELPSDNYRIFKLQNGNFKAVGARLVNENQAIIRLTELTPDLDLVTTIEGSTDLDISLIHDAYIDGNNNTYFCSFKTERITEFATIYSPFIGMLSHDGETQWEKFIGIGPSPNWDAKWLCMTGNLYNDGVVVGGSEEYLNGDTLIQYAVMEKIFKY